MRCNSGVTGLRTVDVQHVLDSVAHQDGLNKTSLKHVKHFLSGALRFALQQGFFDRANPVTATSIPDAPGAAETHAYSLEEIEHMITALPLLPATVVATAALTGLRRGEIRGMLWENFERQVDGTITSYRVSQSIWNGIVSDPKTAKSKAPVPIITSLAQKLESHRAESGHPQSGPVFRNTAGKPLDLNELYRRVMKDVLLAARIQWHGWHAFRRGLATNLHLLSVDDKLIQAILRHSNISTTQNIYMKTVSADAVAAMKRLESVLTFSSGSQDRANKVLPAEPLVN